MHTTITRGAHVAASVLLLGTLAACAPYPAQSPVYQQPSYPQTSYPQQPAYPSGGYQTYPAQQGAPVGTEYGRVANIELLQPQAQQRGQTSGGGALLGAVVGGVLGNQIGGGSGRAAATAVGALGGAVVGNTVEGRNNAANAGSYDQAYRITIQLDQGGLRAYDVSSPGDLHIGDRVRLYNGQISRM
ncbi:glycine zipper 2TM domain-containing protein [Acidovorax sp. SRB_24]|uniref:glycine zipper 2TM domain-containing protein n=1 Tax=Acidovorax sp. SRB_24 TaxID=1962700 RepID=UPI00145E19ED|nr:glycine zipper 2TM domain-containing protein [Acidovorax sp. SRB_24]NMM77379.1 hypothetical protein [Acidovorax sp. SRB_24]